MSILSNRINTLAESETLAMTRRSRELKAKGADIINLSIGEPDFNTPEEIKKAGIQAIEDDFSHYSPVPGYPELRKAVTEKLKRDNNLIYEQNQIVVSTGAKQSIANAVLCLVNPGDEVIIPTPYWVSYKEIIKLAEAKGVFVESSIESGFKVTPEQIEKAITDKTKLFMFSSPCNPSGAVYSYEELEAISKVFERHPNVFIISDEIYEYINYKGKHYSLASFDSIKDRVIVINGLSKGYAMTGWRIGYIAANSVIASACEKLQGQITSGTCSIAQQAAINALLIDPKENAEIIKMQKAFEQRRNLLMSLMKEIKGIDFITPDGAFYLFPNVTNILNKKYNGKTIATGEDLCNYLLDVAHVATVPGSAFGSPECIRISYATSEENIKKAVERIKKAIENLE